MSDAMVDLLIVPCVWTDVTRNKSGASIFLKGREPPAAEASIAEEQDDTKSEKSGSLARLLHQATSLMFLQTPKNNAH